MSLDIFHVCEHGDVNAVRSLLDLTPELVHAVGTYMRLSDT